MSAAAVNSKQQYHCWCRLYPSSVIIFFKKIELQDVGFPRCNDRPCSVICVVKEGGGPKKGKRVQGHRRACTLLGRSQRLWRQGGCDVAHMAAVLSLGGNSGVLLTGKPRPSPAWHRKHFKDKRWMSCHCLTTGC